jgi:hypothetical protein
MPEPMMLTEQQVIQKVRETAGLYQMTDEQKTVWEGRRKVSNLSDAFMNHGIAPNGRAYSMQDVITSTELKPFIEPAIQYVIISAMQPKLLISTYLFREMQITKDVLKMGYIGPLKAERIPEGGRYPDINWVMRETGDAVNITPYKYGLKIPITDEAIKRSEWDVVAFWFERAGWALAAKKEEEATQLIQEAGHVSFDNSAPTSSAHGNTSGRAVTGSQNGTWTLNDLIAQWADLSMMGLNPDTIIMNPLAWAVLMADPELQSVVRQSTLIYEYMPQGQGSPGFPQSEHGGLGMWNKATGWNWPGGEIVPLRPVPATPSATGTKAGADPWSWGLNPMGASFVMKTDMFPGPVRILVTPTVLVDSDGFVNPLTGTPEESTLPATGALATTDIIMASSQYCGVLATPYGPGVNFDEWRDPERDITNTSKPMQSGVWQSWPRAKASTWLAKSSSTATMRSTT